MAAPAEDNVEATGRDGYPVVVGLVRKDIGLVVINNTSTHTMLNGAEEFAHGLVGALRKDNTIGLPTSGKSGNGVVKPGLIHIIPW